MAPVYVQRDPVQSSFPVFPFLRASSLHVGAAAAAASLRHDLVKNGSLSESEFDEAYAIARLTPGTNLLAMYTLIGQRLAGWSGAARALTIGSVVPAIIVALIAAAYVTFGNTPFVAKAMQGARAGALAVFLWAAVRLFRPQFTKHRTRGALVGLVTLVIGFAASIPPLVVLLAAGAIGAVLLRDQT